MANDRYLIAERLAVGSNIKRVYPNAPYIVYAVGTTTPIVRSGAADEFGMIKLTGLAVGEYDIWVDGALRESFIHIPADYAVKHPETWVCRIGGTISADVNETENTEVFYTVDAGKLLRIVANVQYADATANATIHILKGTANAAAALTFASNSIWSVQCNPQQERYRWSHPDPVAQPVIEAQRCVTIGVGYVAGSVKGVTVLMIFKAD